jgi:hypothetical protein
VAAEQIRFVKMDQHQGFLDKIRHPYLPREVKPINLANSNRLESLLRAGKIYLSLRDAIALALENNLDIELLRYGPELARASLLRAQAGGLLRGVPSAVQQGPTSASSQVLGGFTGSSSGTSVRPRRIRTRAEPSSQRLVRRF